MEEWKEYKATEFCYKVTDGTHDSPKSQDKGYYLITSKHIKGNRLDYESAYLISEKDYNKIIERSKVNQWDIIISMIGAYCGYCYIEKSIHTEYAIKNVGLFKVGDEIKCKWLYYYLNSPQGKQQLALLRSGSTQPYISLNSLRNLTFFVPPLKTMKLIVDILSSLDDKIEVNRRINENLEAQAQALFKSWFVDFEPFKDGEFVESELGMIPIGWRVGTLEEVADIVGGATPSKSKKEYYTTDGISWITPKDLSINKNKFICKGEIDITLDGYNNCSVKLMPRGTVLFSSRAPIGYIAIAKNELCTNQGFKSAVPKIAGTAFIYFYLKNNVLNIESMASGSTFKEASGALMKSLKVIIPPLSLLQNFENIVSSLFDKQECLEEESSRLASLRDTLLPKLMSGEVDVNDVKI